ncbi:MAG: Gfo/Idh/MocA family oxidoreductase, partial [Oscillospiraceae bacterium]
KAGGKSVNIIEEWNFEDNKEDANLVKEQNSENPESVYGFGHNPLYKDVIHAIETHSKPLVDAEAGKRALELVLAIYKSAAEGKPVKLPLGDVASTDFSGRFER